jgi:serine/threonine-protein kinase
MSSGIQLSSAHVMQSNEIHPGDVIAGKYRVRAILGRRHGLLVDAFHTEFDQRVAIKVLLAGAGDTKEIERFRREARTLAKLSSEHVARIIDVGSEGDGSFYLVREYLEGTDLARYVKTQGALALQDAVLLILQAAEAVAETHGHGIIVRELQPSTLFLTQRAGGGPLVKLIDFGTAKLMNAAAAPGAGAELTATAMFGLSQYSSPEMIRKAKSADGRTDVWSLGAILYELLTGRAPFTGEAAMLMLQITREEPVPPSQLVPHLPPEIDQVISWALAKDVDARFKNVYAFAHALRPFAPPEGQLLVDRIGQITEAAKRKPKTVSLPPPAAPPARGSQPASIPPPRGSQPASIPPPRGSQPGAVPLARPSGPSRRNEDSLTREYVPGAGQASAAPFQEDTTARFENGGLAAPPPPVPTVPPPSAAAAAAASAPAASPASAPMPSSPPPSGFAASSVPPPRGSSPGYPSSSGVTPGPMPAIAAPAKKPIVDKRIMVGALAAVAVLLPAMIAILVMSKAKGGASTDAVAQTAAVTVPLPSTPASAAVTPPAATSAAAPSATAPAPVASATADAAPSSSAPAGPATQDAQASSKKGTSSSGGSGAVASNNSGASAGANTPIIPKPVSPFDPPAKTSKPDPTPPAGGGGGSGTLMAVALGGSCAFSVNGSSKGSGSSVKVTLPPGSYSVMCKPPGGGIKSKTVTVKSGETAMATFKL